MKEMDFLNNLNGSLINLESQLLKNVDEKYPNIFILGLPRAGTTLLAQMLFNNLDIQCTNNLMAKFWDTPLVGLKLSELVISREKSDYSSTYGKTNVISDPHEFSWFWHKHLKLNDIEIYNPVAAAENIDWDNFKKILINFNHISKKPLIHKPLELIGYHLERFYKLLGKGIFIYIERPIKDIACSLVNARLKYYSDVNKWWGSYPTNDVFCRIKNENYAIQIASQVFYLEKMYQKEFEIINNDRLIKITYNDLCIQPQSVIDKIKKISKNLNFEIKQICNPITFTPSKKIYSEELYSKVISEINKLQNDQ